MFYAMSRLAINNGRISTLSGFGFIVYVWVKDLVFFHSDIGFTVFSANSLCGSNDE
jgi:hypothetical protein